MQIRATRRLISAWLIVAAIIPAAAQVLDYQNDLATSDASNLATRIERNYPKSVVCNPEGSPTDVTVPFEFSSNSNVCLLTQLPSLTTITLYMSSRGRVTSSGIKELAKLPRLESLTIMCPVLMEDGMLEAISQLRRLRFLTLGRAAAPSNEYSFVTNLTSLEGLSILEATNFGSTQLQEFRHLRHLKTLRLVDTAVGTNWLEIIREFPALEEIAVTAKGEVKTWTRASRPDTEDNVADE